MTRAAPITVDVVGTDRLICDGLAKALNATGDPIRARSRWFGRLQPALPAIIQQPPDVLLVDVKQTRAEAFPLVEELRWRRYKLKIVLLGLEHIDDYLVAMKKGVSAYLLIDAPFEVLRETIDMVLNGCKVYPLTDVQRRAVEFRSHAARDTGNLEELRQRLTQRQLEVLRLVPGRSNKEIAKILNITPATVRNHLHLACQRLQPEIAALQQDVSGRNAMAAIVFPKSEFNGLD